RGEHLVLLTRAVLRRGEALRDLRVQVSLPRATVERACGRLHVCAEGLDQVWSRADLLLGVRDTKGLIQDWIEADLTAPPVIVVLTTLAAQEEPPVVHLTAAPDD